MSSDDRAVGFLPFPILTNVFQLSGTPWHGSKVMVLHAMCFPLKNKGKGA